MSHARAKAAGPEPRRNRSPALIAGIAGLVLVLSGCATYHALPLPEHPDLAGQVSDLTVPSDQLALPGSAPAPFDASDGLNAMELAMLAVANNPDLRAAREKLRVGQAESFAAGLLPDPQLDLGVDHPAPSGPDLVNGGIAALSLAISALATHSADVDAARQHVRQVHLELLWQEWQTAQRARELYFRRLAQQELMKELGQDHQLLKDHAQSMKAALARGDAGADAEGASLAALSDLEARLRQLADEANHSQAELNALLGLAPDVEIELQRTPGAPEPIPDKVYREALAKLPTRRPDLLALEAGYQSQDARLRREIMAQFPLVSAGVNRQRDTGNVYSSGLTISLNLPLFDGNRGAIRVARATRQQLHAEYQARLDGTHSQAATLWKTGELLRRQLNQLDGQLPDLERASKAAGEAWRRGELSGSDYLALRQRTLDRREERIRLRTDLATTRIALQTLLALPSTGDEEGENRT